MSTKTSGGVTIYHNPKCSTSRNTLAAIRATGIEPTVIEYLVEPPTRQRIAQLIEAAGLSARELVRPKEKTLADLGLDAQTASEAQLLDAMAAHPILINRPIVVTARGTRLCRPIKRLSEVLPEAKV